MKGEWMDWWCDGVGSTAFETAVARQSHQLLGHGRDDRKLDKPAELGRNAVLPDGSKPTYEQFQPLRRAHLGCVRQRARRLTTPGPRARKTPRQASPSAPLLPHTTCWPRRPTRSPVPLGEGSPGGRFNLGDLTPAEAYPLRTERGLLVLNTLPWPRKLSWTSPTSGVGRPRSGCWTCSSPRGSPGEGTSLQAERIISPGRCRPGVTPTSGTHARRARRSGGRRQLVGERGVPDRGRPRSARDWPDGSTKPPERTWPDPTRDWVLGQYVYERVQLDRGTDGTVRPGFLGQGFRVLARRRRVRL